MVPSFLLIGVPTLIESHFRKRKLFKFSEWIESQWERSDGLFSRSAFISAPDTEPSQNDKVYSLQSACRTSLCEIPAQRLAYLGIWDEIAIREKTDYYRTLLREDVRRQNILSILDALRAVSASPGTSALKAQETRLRRVLGSEVRLSRWVGRLRKIEGQIEKLERAINQLDSRKFERSEMEGLEIVNIRLRMLRELVANSKSVLDELSAQETSRNPLYQRLESIMAQPMPSEPTQIRDRILDHIQALETGMGIAHLPKSN